MSKLLFALALGAMTVPLGAAQDNKLASSVYLRTTSQIASTQQGVNTTAQRDSSYEPPFCPPKSCLYYAGDFDSANSNANGLFNSDDEGASLDGQVWIGVKPNRDVMVTGVTFVEFLPSNGKVGVNPTPFAVQLGIKPGHAGKTICSTSGNATVSLYQYNIAESTYSYTIKKLSKPCNLKKGNIYYVNLLPIFEADEAYVVNVEDLKLQNHHGWKNDLNDCYFNGTSFGANYVTCNRQGAFSEFSIALTGRE